MKKPQYSIVLMALLVLSSLYLGFNTATSTAQGSIDADVEAGDTYFYNLTKFPSFQDLLDLSGASDEFDENNSISFDGGLAGTQIYVKVLDKGAANMSYWDGSSEVIADVPTIDMATGLITGQDVTVTATIDGNTTEETLPAGVGLPIPFIFGSATLFNFSIANADPFLPIPLVLSDDYDLHELIFSQAQSQFPAGALSIVNDASQFKVQVNDLEIDDEGSITLDGFFSYEKPSGIAQEVNLVVTNTTSSEILVDIDFDLVRKEHRPLNINVGDTFELTVSDAAFDVDTFGFPADENPQAEIDEIEANVTAQIGETLLAFEVVEIRGLFYSIEGNVSIDGETMPLIEEDDLHQDLWMVGFGRIGPGMLIATEDPARTYDTYYDEEAGEDVIGDLVDIRNRALFGPFMTADDDIYTSWDATLAAGVARADELIKTALNFLRSDLDPTRERVSSTSGADPVISPSFSSHSDADGYAGWTLGLTVDISVWENDTESYDDGFGGTIVEERFYETNVTGSASFSVGYSNGVMDEVTFSLSAEIARHEWNSTDDSINAGITINEISLTLSGEYTPVVPIETSTTTGTSDPTDTSDGATETPELPLPGFELAFTVISMIAFAFVLRRRQY